MSKSLLTNLVAVFVVFISFFTPEPYKNIILSAGLFALSGAITNWLAIHMLFEKVPFLYGSGVILDRFEEFKLGIHGLIMNQFFTKENLERFFSYEKPSIDFEPIIAKTDISPAFESLKNAVMESSFGSMLAMFKGASLLDGLKDSFEKKMKASLVEITKSDNFQNTLKNALSKGELKHEMLLKIDKIVTSRLDELTPLMVKDIIQKMIKEHLGWLVVWGGVFGALIGFASSLIL